MYWYEELEKKYQNDAHFKYAVMTLDRLFKNFSEHLTISEMKQAFLFAAAKYEDKKPTFIIVSAEQAKKLGLIP